MNEFVADFNLWLGIIIGIIGIVQVVCTAFVAWMVQKSRADMAEFELRLMNGIREILKGYVPSQQFTDFLVVNQKEHKDYEDNVKQIQHWQYKDIEPAFRMTQSNVDAHSHRLDDHDQRLRELEGRA